MADNNKKSNFSSLSQGEGRGEALITGAEALMRSLEHQGVKTIFGYPGGSIMPVFDALYDHRKELNHILVRHEQGATHAAQGFARVSGEVGVCLVTSGPGATNTITGIADAMIDSTPIVVIAGQVGTNFSGYGCISGSGLGRHYSAYHEMELPDSSCRRCGLGSGTCFLCGKERTSGTGRAGFC